MPLAGVGRVELVVRAPANAAWVGGGIMQVVRSTTATNRNDESYPRAAVWDRRPVPEAHIGGTSRFYKPEPTAI